MPTPWTTKPFGPAEIEEVLTARLLTGKAAFQLNNRLRVVFHVNILHVVVG